MPSLGQQLGQAVRNGLCLALKGGEVLEDFVRTVISPTQPDFKQKSRYWYAQYCDEPPPPIEPPPFTGGQCEFCYISSLQYTVVDSEFPQLNGTFTSESRLWGPVSGFTFFDGGPTGTPGRQWTLTVTDYGRCLLPRGDSPIRDELNRGSLGSQGKVTIDSFSVVPESGQPDVCGDPPDEPPPSDPDNRKFPIDIDIVYDDGTDLEFSGDVFFGFAYFDNDFNLRVPIRFNLDNNINFNGDFNFNTGDINLNFGDDYDFPSPPPPEGDYGTDPTAPPPPPTTVPPPETFPPPFPPEVDDGEGDERDYDDDQPKQNETIRRVVGVLVDTLTPPSTSTELNQDVNPNVYVPDIGLVNFGYLIDGNKFYWGEDIRVKNRRQVIFTPGDRYAVAVDGTPRNGAEWVLTPIYARVPVDSVGGL